METPITYEEVIGRSDKEKWLEVTRIELLNMKNIHVFEKIKELQVKM